MTIIQLWELKDGEAKPEILHAAAKLFSWLNGRDDDLSRLLTGRPCERPTKDSVRDLEHDIIDRFKPLRETVHYLRALGLVIDHGNKQGLFELCPPRIPILIKRQPSPFLEGRMPLLKRPRLWREAINGSEGSRNEMTESEAIGRVLASAALNGGLLHPSLLAALYDSLSDGVFLLRGRSHVELRLPWQGKPDMERRRWFPDPLTEVLILNLEDSHLPACASDPKRRTTTKDVWSCLTAFFKATVPDKLNRPRNITDFLEPIGLELRTKIPIYLVAYAERRFVSHSLKDYAWARLHGIPVTAEVVTRASETGNADRDEVPDSEPANDNASTFQPAWFSDLTRALGGKDKNAARKEIVKLIKSPDATPDATLVLFAGWAEHMLTKGSATGNPLKLSTIRDYVRRISVRVAGLTAFDDVTAQATEVFEEIYQQILEGATSFGQRRHHTRGLREFHRYLVERYQVEPIDEREILGIGNALAPVDANLLTVDEYKKTLARLDTLDLDVRHPDLPLVAKLLVILSFRCALRRMEVLKLETQDLHDDDPAELIVRPHAQRRLKTKSSTRKIPLYALLEPEELALLKQWKAKRVKQQGDGKEPFFLFGIPGLLHAYVPEESIFPIIHRAMRGVTGDPTIRFHHLRHSCPSWGQLRLLLSGFESVPELFPHLPETQAFLAASRDFRKALYGHDHPTRKHLYALASVLGHSGPDISLAHYIHTCDLALALALASRPGALDETALVRCSGLPPATAYRWLKQHGVAGLLGAVRKRVGKRVRRLDESSPRKGGQKQFRAVLGANREEDENSVTAILYRIWKYLFVRSTRNEPREDLARRFGLSLAQAEALEQHAGHLRDLKVTNTGKRRWRHRMMEITPDKRYPGETRRLPCPRWPRLARDLAVMEELAPRLWQLMRTDEALCRRVLDYYVKHAWATRNELVFYGPTKPGAAKDYLTFLKGLGIDLKRIRFVAYQRKERSKTLVAWRSALGLGWRVRIGRLAPPNNTREATEQWLGIKPLFSRANAKEEGSYGFRFLLTMAAIYIHSVHVYRSSTERQLPDAA
ncbi:MAG: hypothetical protein EPN55_13350 [Gammaproteobacteria bacterium]|nr:MAG: hypothetical protein EPN55_13350 [Gammaproteobacteria bacterium]